MAGVVLLNYHAVMDPAHAACVVESFPQSTPFVAVKTSNYHLKQPSWIVFHHSLVPVATRPRYVGWLALLKLKKKKRKKD